MHTVFYNANSVYTPPITSFVTDFRVSIVKVGNGCYVRDYNTVLSNKLTRVNVNNIRNTYSAGRLTDSETWTEEMESSREMVKEIRRNELKYYTYKTIVLNGNQKKTVLEKIITAHYYQPNHTIDTLTYNYAETSRLNWERYGNLDGAITTKYNSYTPAGLCLSKTLSAAVCDPRTESYLYDNTQRFLTQVTNPEGHISKSTFDGKTGNKLTETDINGLITTYQYDAFGNLTQINYPDGTKTNISVNWNTASNPPNTKYFSSTITTGKPDLFVYYDILGREVCRHDDGCFFQTVYNKKGQVQKTSGPFLKFSDSDIVWQEYTYDIFGRKKTEKSPAYINLSYTYNKRLITITDNLRGISSSKDYDPLGRISKVSDWGGEIEYDYFNTSNYKHKTTITTNDATTVIISDLWGNRLSIDDPNAGKIVSTYNKFNELVSQTDARGNITKYEYDKLGRMSKKQFTAPGGTPQTFTYIYDNASGKGIGKLAQIKLEGNPVETFSYDTYTYNKCGLMNKRIESVVNRTEKYEYDELDRLVKIVVNNESPQVFSYAENAYYIYGDNGIVAMRIYSSGSSKMYYIHPDHLGSYCVITDKDKKVAQSNRFDPWGNNVGTVNFSITKRGFTGHEHYPQFKIINMNARLYDPMIGRFFSPDNFVQIPEFTQAYNRYSYCLNNPLKYVDPSGNLYNPIYDTEGKHLGNTKEGFTGDVLIYSGKEKHDWKSMSANAATNIKGVSLIQDVALSAQAFSKICTDVLEKGGFNIKSLIGNAVAVRNGDDQFNNPSDRKFASGTIGLPSKVSVNQQHPSAAELLTTVENIQNLLGVHELQGHGQNKFGTPFKTHHKAYELQINHSTWDKTTSNYKADMLHGYLFHYNNEVPNARFSSEYLKYFNLMNLYKK